MTKILTQPAELKSKSLSCRWAAEEAVYPACRKDSDIRLFYDKKARRKGANTAKVTRPKRLLTIIYKVLKDERHHIPYRK